MRPLGDQHSRIIWKLCLQEAASCTRPCAASTFLTEPRLSALLTGFLPPFLTHHKGSDICDLTIQDCSKPWGLFTSKRKKKRNSQGTYIDLIQLCNQVSCSSCFFIYKNSFRDIIIQLWSGSLWSIKEHARGLIVIYLVFYLCVLNALLDSCLCSLTRFNFSRWEPLHRWAHIPSEKASLVKDEKTGLFQRSKY